MYNSDMYLHKKVSSYINNLYGASVIEYRLLGFYEDVIIRNTLIVAVRTSECSFQVHTLYSNFIPLCLNKPRTRESIYVDAAEMLLQFIDESNTNRPSLYIEYEVTQIMRYVLTRSSFRTVQHNNPWIYKLELIEPLAELYESQSSLLNYQ